MPRIDLDDRERALLTLLVAGHTDLAAAEPRISIRLVTKILRVLMDRLGVDNRFQPGVALGATPGANPLDSKQPDNHYK